MQGHNSLDDGPPLPKKHLRNSRRKSHSPVLEVIEVKSTDPRFSEYLGLLWEAIYYINGDDLNGEKRLQIGEATYIVPEIEEVFHDYIAQGHRIHVALHGNEAVGLMVFSHVFPGLASIRFCYAVESKISSHVGKGLIESIPGIRALLFQTRKEKPPLELLKIIRKYEAVLLDELEKFHVWYMPWRV